MQEPADELSALLWFSQPRSRLDTVVPAPKWFLRVCSGTRKEYAFAHPAEHL